MAPHEWILIGIGLILALAVVFAGAFLARRAWLETLGALFDCAIRVHAKGRIWRVGLALYQGDCVLWYPIWSLIWKPGFTIRREHAELLGQRRLEGREGLRDWTADHVLNIRLHDEQPVTIDVCLDEGSTMGMLSWLEAGPPGQRRTF